MGWIRRLGIFFASIKGWAYAMSLIPTATAFLAGLFEELSWAATTAYSTVALAAGLAVVYYVLVIWERTTLYFKTGAEQTRIAAALDNLGENVDDLDLATTAGIWAGTLAGENVERHSYFRGLKNAITRGHLVVTHRPDGPNPGPGTRVDLNSLKDFWRKRKVIR